MDTNLEEKFITAIWIGKTLFDRGKVTGASSNMSFSHHGEIYISGSGASFGRLTKDSFVRLGTREKARTPSKEYPLHQQVYDNKPSAGAVLHTHSFYATLWSCLPHAQSVDILPAYTPYLQMRVGTIGLVPYAPPGSAELFAAFARAVSVSDGYLLQNHGAVICGKNLLNAFYGMEELEESAKIAWHLRKEKDALQIPHFS